jgi:hypothetical protein
MSKLIVDVAGFKELESKIIELSNDRDKKREMLLILRQVAKPTVAVARQVAPKSKKPHLISGKTRSRRIVQPGSLAKSIGDFVGKKGGSRINPTVYVGPRVKGGYDGFYGAWVHDGFNIYNKGFKRDKTRKGANDAFAKKRIQGNPYMDKAYAQTEGRVTADAEKRTAKFIQRRINKLSNA